MAWRSSGTTNDEMVDNLKRFGVISSDVVEGGFRNVDRKLFVPKGREDVAHSDQPLKEGNVHISAPHIYGSALESLELVPNSSLSFLNIGSGTGYLSCIVADILGHRSLNYGIEIHPDVVQHSRVAISKWEEQAQTQAQARANTSSSSDSSSKNNTTAISTTNDEVSKTAHVEIIHGNGLHISKSFGECKVGFDRIYVGAAVEKADLSKLTRLLRPGGVLVGPVDDELVKVVRIGSIEEEDDNNVNKQQRTTNNDFTQQVLSGVRFAPLTPYPLIETKIPSRVWQPSIHQSYPDSFRMATKELMLCSYSEYDQQQQPPPKPPAQKQPNVHTNAAAMLPPVLWMDILSFTHRNWFEPPQSEANFLRKRLLEEQANSQKAHQARLEAEGRCHIAERERDVYRLLARRWQSRVQALLQQRNNQSSSSSSRSNNTNNNNATANDDEDANREDSLAMALALSGNEQAAIFGLGAMLRHLHGEDDENDDDDGDDDDDEERGGRRAEAPAVDGMSSGGGGNQNMDEDHDIDVVGEEDDDDDNDDAMEDNNDEYEFVESDDDDDDRMNDDVGMDEDVDLRSPSTSKELVVRAAAERIRTVSMSSD